MNVALIFPPLFTNVNQPHVAMPYLAAVLKANGHSAAVYDLNIAFIQWLLEEDGWNFVHSIIDRLWENLHSASKLEVLAQKEYMDLVWTAGRDPGIVKDEFLTAIHTLKDPVAGYIWEEYDGASRILSRLWSLLSYWSFLSGMDTNEQMSDDILPANDAPGTYYGRMNVISPQVMVKRLKSNTKDLCYTFLTNAVSEFVEEKKAGLLGFSITTLSQLEPSLRIAQALYNKFGKDLKIVLGGNIITRLKSVFTATPDLLKGIYAAITYEGEIPIVQLAACEERKNIQNLVYFDEGRCYENPVGTPMDIDQIPAPDFSDLNLKNYCAPDPILPIVPGHGCDWKQCAFCNIFLGYSQTQDRSSERVAKDMISLHKQYGAHLFTLYQESISAERLKEISMVLIKEGVNIKWEASSELEQNLNKNNNRGSTNVEQGFSAESCEIMYQAGCRCLHFGLESVSNRIIRLMKRNITPEVADKVLHNTSQAGIMNAITLISGFPTETKEEARHTAHFLEERADIMHSVSVSVYYISKGSPVDLHPGDYGVFFNRDSIQPFQMAITEYDCSSGMTNRERNAHALELSSKMQTHGCVLPVDPPLRFCAYYETNKPQVIFEKSRQLMREKQNDTGDDHITTGPKLHHGVMLRMLRFPLDHMRKLFVHPLSKTDSPSESVERSEGLFCLDSAKDRVIRLSQSAFNFLNLCDGRSFKKLQEAYAKKENITIEKAASQSRLFLSLYKAFLE